MPAAHGRTRPWAAEMLDVPVHPRQGQTRRKAGTQSHGPLSRQKEKGQGQTEAPFPFCLLSFALIRVARLPKGWTVSMCYCGTRTRLFARTGQLRQTMVFGTREEAMRRTDQHFPGFRLSNFWPAAVGPNTRSREALMRFISRLCPPQMIAIRQGRSSAVRRSAS
jgi:hypothetical protein